MQTIAIIIGISEYEDRYFDPIIGAKSDASRFASSLISWGIPQENIYTLFNNEATKDNIVKTFYDILPYFDSDAKLIFYFAGHGIREKYQQKETAESFLICNDTKMLDIEGSGFRLVELMQLLHILKPTQAFLFIDACSLRLNQIDNPLNDKEIFSTTNSKGLFCLFSSGVHPSFENIHIPYGYFSNALLKALGTLRQKEEANCYDLVKFIGKELKELKLHPPEVYHIGLETIWPLNKIADEKIERKTKISNGLVHRLEALGQLQDHLVSIESPLIWMWGEGGMGKTVIAEQLYKSNGSAIYITIPNGLSGIESIELSLVEQIRTQKGELFFNRPPENSIVQVLSLIVSKQPDTLLIIDHLDHLSHKELEKICGYIDSLFLSVILISRYPCPLHFFNKRESSILEWLTISLNIDEVEKVLSDSSLDPSYAPVLLNASKGNVLKLKQLLAKLLGQEIAVEGSVASEYIRSMQAIAATGGFIDELLFCHTFLLNFKTLSTLESLGLIRYTPSGCYPHDALIEMVEQNEWPIDIHQASVYWKRQIKKTPYNKSACKSLTLLASELNSCTHLKGALKQCLETLNEREYVRYLIDLISIFLKEGWEDLLLQASDYLIDHEEYQMAGEVLSPLLLSKKLNIRYHAYKNDARRLVWLGQFGLSIASNIEILKKCRSPNILVPLKNNIGIAHFFSGDLDKALLLFNEVIDSKGKKDEREVGVAKLMIGLIMTYRGENVNKAKELLEGSLKIFETTKYYLWNIVSLNSLGDLFYRLEQWHQALYYLNKAIEIAEVLQNKTFLLFTLKNIARVHLRLFKKDSQELSMTVESLEMCLKTVLETGHNWVTAWALNVLGTIYAIRNEPDKLQKVVDEVVPLTKDYKECHIFTLSNLGHLYTLKNQKEASKKCYEEAFQLTSLLKNVFAFQEISKDMSSLRINGRL